MKMLSAVFELQNLLVNRRRIFYSILAGAFSVPFFFAAIITAAIEAGLQYDAQGFVMWSALFSVASAFGAVAVASLILARALFPKPVPPQVNLAMLYEKFHVRELLDKWTQQTAPMSGVKN